VSKHPGPRGRTWAQKGDDPVSSHFSIDPSHTSNDISALGAPDPYDIDDDMVLVNGNGDVDVKESRGASKHSRSKSKREVR
jgi:hypothetical protein